MWFSSAERGVPLPAITPGRYPHGPAYGMALEKSMIGVASQRPPLSLMATSGIGFIGLEQDVGILDRGGGRLIGIEKGVREGALHTVNDSWNVLNSYVVDTIINGVRVDSISPNQSEQTDPSDNLAMFAAPLLIHYSHPRNHFETCSGPENVVAGFFRVCCLTTAFCPARIPEGIATHYKSIFLKWTLSMTISSMTNHPIRFSTKGSTSFQSASGGRDCRVRKWLNVSWETT